MDLFGRIPNSQTGGQLYSPYKILGIIVGVHRYSLSEVPSTSNYSHDIILRSCNFKAVTVFATLDPWSVIRFCFDFSLCTSARSSSMVKFCVSMTAEKFANLTFHSDILWRSQRASTRSASSFFKTFLSFWPLLPESFFCFRFFNFRFEISSDVFAELEQLVSSICRFFVFFSDFLISVDACLIGSCTTDAASSGSTFRSKLSFKFLIKRLKTVESFWDRYNKTIFDVIELL